MTVKVIDLITGNMVRATGDDWYKLCKKVKEIRNNTPAEEEITLDFKDVFAECGTDTGYANNIAAMPGVNVVMYNNLILYEQFRIVALLAKKKPESIKNVEVEIKSLTRKPLSEKEIALKNNTKKFADIMRREPIMNGVMYVEPANWAHKGVKSIQSKDMGEALRQAILEVTKEKLAEGTIISKILVRFEHFEIAGFIPGRIADDAPEYNALGIQLSIRVTSDEETRKLKLKTDIGLKTLEAPEKVKILREDIKLGTVGVLTKFKKRKSDKIELRLEDKITNQYIAILAGVVGTKKMAIFKCFKYSELESMYDEYAKCGEYPDAPTSKKIEINIDELGINRICIGKAWHFNQFDGTADGIYERQTRTGADISMLSQPETVIIPEYVRRALKSYSVKFNEETLLANIEKFRVELSTKDR